MSGFWKDAAELLRKAADARRHSRAARAPLMAEAKATDAELIAAYEREGSYRKAAKSLGMDESVVRRRMNSIKGTSTLFNEQGARVLTWVKADHKNDEKHAEVLAAPDAYASRGGWMSGRSADVITYDANRGEVCRITVNP